MKTKFKNLYIVLDPSGYPMLHTLQYFRKDSVEKFMSSNGDSEWKEWQKGGWSVQKVDVNFQPV